MKKHIHSLILLCLLLCTYTAARAQLTMVDNLTAAQLADKLAGQGVIITNPTLTCNVGASGSFEGVSNLGLDSGIVLCTGKIVSAAGINGVNSVANLQMTTIANTPGDPDLSAIVGNTTYDACILEFDFQPKGDTIRFRYVFASEEYPEFACSSVNDAFALLISGPGIVSNTPMPTKRNIAIVPNTNIPVMINSINNGTSANIATCNAVGPGSPFPLYYVDNLLPSPGQFVVFDGFTTVLTAEQEVIPCENYHLKLAISNTGDGIYDSGVFLEAGSLTSPPIETENITGGGGGSSLLHTVRDCKPAVIRYKRPGCDTLQPFTFHLDISGTALNGTDYSTIANTLTIPGGSSTIDLPVQGLLPATGTKYVVLGILSPDSIAAGASIVPIVRRDTVYIIDSLFVDILTPEQAVCPNTTITIVGEADPSLEFHWSPAQYDHGDLVITPTMLTTRDFKLTVTQPDGPATCPSRSKTYHALVEQYPIIMAPSDTIVCVQDSAVIPVLVYPDTVNYLYNWSPPTGLRAANIATNFLYRTPGTYTYMLTVTTPQANCTSTHQLDITVRPPFELSNLSPASGTIVDYGTEADLSAEGAMLYTWLPTNLYYDPDWSQVRTFPIYEPTTFTVVGIDNYGCKDTAEIFLDVRYPHDPIMPNAFTPNGDGKNDVFGLNNAQYQKLLRFEIYNRWGQQVFSTNNPMTGWDGTYKGEPCGQGVYTYIISLELPDKTMKTYKGDVTLFR